MKYRLLSLVVIFIALIFVIFDSNYSLRSETLGLTDSIKIRFLNTKEGIKNIYHEYINQADTIKDYQEKFRKHEALELEIKFLQSRLEEFKNLNQELQNNQNPNFIPTKAFSYVSIGNYNRIWLDFNPAKYNKDKVFGLVQNNNAIGIAIIKDHRLLGLLNGDENSSFAVYIGSEKIPALIRYDSSNAQKILADFIPAWLKINIGDEVVTSGLDGIFTPNIKVGKVTQVLQNYGYNTAEVSPYATKIDLGYMWLVDTKIPQINLDTNNTNGDY